MPNDDGKIYITISDERGQTPTQRQTQENGQESKESALSKYAQHEFMHLIKHEATKTANYIISNVGFYSGDYTAQRHINEAFSIGNSLLNVGMSAYGGAILTGTLAGGLIGGAVAIIGMTTNIALEEIKYNTEIKRNNMSINKLKDISGLNNLTNGSR